jgi:hypothetical protein
MSETISNTWETRKTVKHWYRNRQGKRY